VNTLYFAPFIFFCIAFVFSMLGMGGSQLYIPILYWMGLDFRTEAIPLGMLLNVVNSATAATTYSIKKMVLWQAALPFALTMLILPPVGAWLNAQIPTKPLIAFFAVFTATAAALMLSGWKPQKGEMSSKGRILLGLSGGSVLGLIAGLIGRNWSRGGGGISLRFKSSALDFPRDLASGGPVCVRRTGRCLPPPSVGLSSASAERASPRSKSWKIKAPPPCLRQAGRGRQASRSEKRRHPVITYHWSWGWFSCRAFALYGRAGGKSPRGHLRICGHLLGRVEFHRSLGDSGKTQLVHLDGLRDCRFYRK